ncbi:DUF6773 family protein [Lachnospiraceae bacterium 54-11]
MKKFKWFEKKVDERQERDIMEVEHIGFWSMYYMLLAAIIIQAFFIEDGGKHLVGEFVVFMAASVIVVVGWIRKGVWTYQSRKVPGVKAYLRYSIITMLVFGLPFGIYNGIRAKRDWSSIAADTAITMLYIFIVCFVTFMILGTITKKREEKLASQTYEENEDEEDL